MNSTTDNLIHRMVRMTGIINAYGAAVKWDVARKVARVRLPLIPDPSRLDIVKSALVVEALNRCGVYTNWTKGHEIEFDLS